MRHKQEELEALAQSQSYIITGMSEIWWDESCNWCAVMNGYRLFRVQAEQVRCCLQGRRWIVWRLQLVMTQLKASG